MTAKLKLKFIGTSVLTLVAIVAFVGFGVFATEFLASAIESEGLSKGLGMAVALIVMIICDGVLAVIMFTGGIGNLLTADAYDGIWKKITVGMGIFNISAFAISVVTTVIFVILNNNGTFA
jgi:uncharacterized membrane protein (DUF485 family)